MKFAKSLAVGTLSALIALPLVAPLASCASSDKAEGSSSNSQAQSREKSPDYQSTSDDQKAAESGSSSETATSSGGSITDEQLDQFVRISQKLRQVKKDTQQAARSANTRKEKQKVRNEAKKRMKSIFADEAMTRQEYRQVAQKLQTDRELRRRLKQRMKQKQQ